MVARKKATKKRGKKAGKIEAAIAAATTDEARIKSRPPLLRAIFALVDLLCMPPLESDRGDHLYGKAREELEEKRRATLVQTFIKPDRFEWHVEHMSLDDVRQAIEDTIAGGPPPHSEATISPARADARQLAQRLVDRVFDLRESKLTALIPATMKRLSSEAKAKRDAENEAQKRKYAEQEAARRAKAAGGRKKKASKKPSGSAASRAKRTSSLAKPAKSSTPKPAKKATAKAPKPAKPPRGKAAKAEAAGQLPLGSSPATPPSASTDKPTSRVVPAARCTETSGDGMRCMHQAGHKGEHTSVAGDSWV